MWRTLTETERCTIANALRTAAGVYHDAIAHAGTLGPQFERQEQTACDWADRIENAELIELQEGAAEAPEHCGAPADQPCAWRLRPCPTHNPDLFKGGR